jgi:NAD(P)-dependent dehydrogenase (short-subunit alcohol dehydrogenase family)
MRPIAEQTILITGATDGHGWALAAELAAAGATVLIHGRDGDRAQRSIDEIRAKTGHHQLDAYCADFSSLEQASALADAVAAGHDRLDALVNNAGIGTTTAGDARREESHDGYELRFAVNYLAGYLLTRQLVPLLERSAPARIVNVASIGQTPIDFADVMLEHGYDGRRAYCQSKLAQIMFTLDLAEELADREVTANALHPATYMPTKIVRADGITPTGSLADGVSATLRLIADSDLDAVTGRYFNGSRPAEPHPQAGDRDARRRLRELSDQLSTLSSPSSRR